MPRRVRADATAKTSSEAVRRVHQERRETLEEVASRLEWMDAKYLGELERGWQPPSISTAKRIADALDVARELLVRAG